MLRLIVECAIKKIAPYDAYIMEWLLDKTLTQEAKLFETLNLM